jgi:integrase
MAYTLEISEDTLHALVHSGLIPHTYVTGRSTEEKMLRFNPFLVREWLQTRPNVDDPGQESYIDALRGQFKSLFPDTLDKLKSMDARFAPRRRRKGYSLSKVPNKQYAFLYYVRYIENGKLIPSRWNTHTKDIKAAESFARDNRDRILAAYKNRKDAKDKLYAILGNYYGLNSPYLERDKQRGRHIVEENRQKYFNFIHNFLIPFFKKNNIQCFGDITPPVVVKVQDALLAGGNKPQTINSKLSGIVVLFDNLVQQGIVSENVFSRVKTLTVDAVQVKKWDCHEINQLYGVLNKSWKNDLHYLLVLIIYSTGMRNSEIERIKTSDLVKINECCFIDIKESKTSNGIRLVPLHPFVHEKLKSYVRRQKRKPDEHIFPKIHWYDYTGANLTLGRKLYPGKTGEQVAELLSQQHIDFYSGRHYWKTLMNANKLGDVEEYFMGHKVPKSVAERYNHRDKQGQKQILKKAREVMRILDKSLFKGHLTERTKRCILDNEGVSVWLTE